jgi:hypothetical protein
MLALPNEKVFSIGGVTYVAADLVRAARRWGDWAKLEDEVRQGLACATRADETHDDVDDEALEAAAREFRYERDLISGQEMEAWLARWSIDADDWMEYLRRCLLRERWAAVLAPVLAEYPVDPEDVEVALHVEAVCSGFVARIARRLAGRTAAAARARDEGWLAEAPPHDASDRGLEHVDAGFRRFCERVVTPAALTAQVAAHRLEWIRADCRCLVLPTIESAKEAALCVRADGMALDEVARNAGVEVLASRGFLDEYDAALLDALVAARPGELLGPTASGDRFLLVLVRDKVLPAPDDPAVRRRAEERLLDVALAREVHDRVEWHRAELAT